MPDIRLYECLWIKSKNTELQPCCRPIYRAAEKHGAKMWMLDISSAAEIQKLREYLWKSDQHVILQGLLPREMNVIRPIFESRKNFSVMPIDWWVSPFWFSQHATFNIFHNYNGIMARSGRAPFIIGAKPPWLMIPDRLIPYEIQSALLRPAALAVAPFLDLYKRYQRAEAAKSETKFVFFPSPIDEADVPLHSETPKWDFTNIGALVGPWVMRDPFAPASLNFANMYADRRRLIDLLMQFDGKPFTVYDRRRHPRWLPWEELTRLIRQTRYMVCAGGVHHSSVVKFLEYACLGIPMIGTSLPYEHAWLDDCMISVDPLRMTPAELKPRLVEAVERYSTLRANCLAVRDRLLKMYHAETLMEMLQEQLHGKPIRPGYVKPGF